ncbi:MAG: rod shape-determining protein RodA [Treponema sp.]|jgi:rod shape determining protein RodA|nr:rod shape-determining protein RodA [Treponema sp.]
MKAKDIVRIDFVLLFAAITLTVFGVLFIYSSGLSSTGTQGSTEYFKQIIWGASGLFIALGIGMIDYRRFHSLSLYLYLGTLGLLLYTCIFGHTVNGAKAWIGIGNFGIQPSEFAKITTILFLARYLDSSKRKTDSFVRFLGASLIVFIPMAIVLIQPDFGTSLVFIPILLMMTFMAGVSVKYIIFLVSFIGLTAIFMVLPLWQDYIFKNALPSLMMITNLRFIGLVALALTLIGLLALVGFLLYKKGYFFWIVYGVGILIFSLGASYLSHKVLKDYQLMRLIVFLDPNVDPRGAGWNIIQSITAIGSGGLLGKGYLEGTHSHYRFLPQQSTDFIFSIFSEEWGFMGGILVFALFLLISLRLVRIMKTAADSFGVYIVAGLSAMYSFHFLINVGMTMGIMPITGIPLLFMSYGGSAVISAMTGIGLALSVYIRRFIR